MVLTRVMRDFSFAVDLTALVRVRAADESVARKIVPTVVKAPNALEVRLANESNALLNSGGTVTKVDFSFKETSIKLAKEALINAAMRPLRLRRTFFLSKPPAHSGGRDRMAWCRQADASFLRARYRFASANSENT